MKNQLITLLLLITCSLIFISGSVFANQKFEQAEKLLKNREYEKAAENFLAFAENNSDDQNAPFALYTAARIRMIVQEKPVPAETLFTRLIENYPESEWAFYGATKMAAFCTTGKDSVKSAGYYQQAVEIGAKIYPSISSADDAQFKALRDCGAASLKLNKYQQALHYYSQLKASGIDDNRQMPAIYFNLALCLEKTQKPSEAAGNYVDLLHKYPNSQQGMSLLGQKDKVDAYQKFNWTAYEYFIDGYKVFRIQPNLAAGHFMKLEKIGADSSLVQHGLRLLPWVYYYGNAFEKASKAHAAYQKRYPDDPDKYVKYFPMYVASYREDFEFKQYLTGFSVLRIEADTSQSLSETDEYQLITNRKDWVEVDLNPNFGVYNHALYIDRPLNSTDRAWLRFYVKAHEPKQVYLEIDTDETGRIWHDGTFLTGYEANAKNPVALQLNKGWNELVIQLTQTKNNMKATVRILNSEKQVAEKLVCAAKKR